jgi:hypothetical protein
VARVVEADSIHITVEVMGAGPTYTSKPTLQGAPLKLRLGGGVRSSHHELKHSRPVSISLPPQSQIPKMEPDQPPHRFSLDLIPRLR